MPDLQVTSRSVNTTVEFTVSAPYSGDGAAVDYSDASISALLHNTSDALAYGERDALYRIDSGPWVTLPPGSKQSVAIDLSLQTLTMKRAQFAGNVSVSMTAEGVPSGLYASETQLDGSGLFSGAYADLTGKPTLGTAAATAASAYATAAQGTKADAGAVRALNYLYAKADYGAVGDGVADDTAAIEAMLDDVVDLRGQTLIFEPGVYLVDPIVTAKRGVRMIGLGHRVQGPGANATFTGVVIKTTATGGWTWTINPFATGENEYHGWHIENITFMGDADTAGGLLLKNSYCTILNCGAYDHQAGIGLKIMYDTTAPANADSAQINQITNWASSRCLIAGQVGESGMTPGSACQTELHGFTSLGPVTGGTGFGLKIYDNASSIHGGKVEGHGVGVLSSVRTGGIALMGTRFEGNTIDIDLDGGDGSAVTGNVICTAFADVRVNASQVQDIIICASGTNGHTIHADAKRIIVLSNGQLCVPYLGASELSAAYLNGAIALSDTGKLQFVANGVAYEVQGTPV